MKTALRPNFVSSSLPRSGPSPSLVARFLTAEHNNPEQKARMVQQKHGLTCPILLDENGKGREAYRVGGLPDQHRVPDRVNAEALFGANEEDSIEAFQRGGAGAAAHGAGIAGTPG